MDDQRNVIKEVFVSEIASETNKETSVNQVSLMGVVTDSSAPTEDLTLTELVERFGTGKPHIYKIDDGTGVISVIHFPRRHEMDLERAAVLEQATSRGEGGAMLQKTLKASVAHYGGFAIGTSVHVTGKYRYKRGEVTVVASSVQNVIDPNHEIQRILAKKV